ncbi:MAG: heme biosynthesis HemY N-terminal domain-containing protein [Lysobacterales bacterium]|jgi:HemY protein
MKAAFLVLIAFALALLAAALAPVFKADPGMVQIHFRGWTVETSVLVLIFGVLLAWLLIWLLLWIWKMPSDAARRVREKRSLVQLEKGLLALTEGDWQTAERALERSASAHGRTTARYLAAAEAAGGQDAPDRAEYYLEQADTRNRKQKFIVELTRAKIMVSGGQFEEARPILEELHSRRKKHPQVLEMLARCYTELGEWEPLVGLLPVMLKTKMLDTEKAAELKQQAAVTELRRSRDAEALQSDWRGLPKALQQDAVVVRTFAERAVELDAPELNEEVIRVAMKRRWDSSLLLPYGIAGPDDASKRMRQCEKWLKDHPEDSALHLALGRICAREELWGKAREHLVRSLELEPTVAGYDSLGQLLERKGELEVAMACFRNALRMNQGRDPKPLPGELARLEAPDL